MVGRSKTPTKAEKDRMTVIKGHIPCLACLFATGRVRLPEIDHKVSGMKREGHDKTSPLCPYHHRGLIPDGHTKQTISGLLGPSLAWGKRTFEEFFGHENLRITITTRLVKSYEESPWIDYEIPYELQRRAFNYWSENR